MTAFAARVHLTQALARFLRGEAEPGRRELAAARAEGADPAQTEALSAAAGAEPAILVALARDLNLDVTSFCRARVLAAYWDLDWSQIPRWEAAVLATGDIPALSWMAQVDYNSGRWQRSLEKLEMLCRLDPQGDYRARLAECLARLEKAQG